MDTNYPVLWHHIEDEQRLQLHHRGSVKTRMILQLGDYYVIETCHFVTFSISFSCSVHLFQRDHYYTSHFFKDIPFLSKSVR